MFLRHLCQSLWGFFGGSHGKESTCKAGAPGFITGLGRSPGEGNGNPLQASLLAWRTAWTAEAGGLQSMGLQRVGHNWTTFTSCIAGRFFTSWTTREAHKMHTDFYKCPIGNWGFVFCIFFDNSFSVFSRTYNMYLSSFNLLTLLLSSYCC